MKLAPQDKAIADINRVVTAGIFKKLDHFLPGVKGQSDYDRAQDIENALDWLHGNGVDLDGFADPA